MNPTKGPTEDGEEKNIKTETSQKNIYGLLKDGIEREFGNPMDPRKFDAYKKNKAKNKENIRTHMADLRMENMEEWGGIDTHMIIGEATDEKITEQILRMSKDLVFRRKRAYDRAIELFPSISDTDRDLLQDEIAGYNADELLNCITRNSAMRNMVYGVLPGLRVVSPSEHKDFDTIFHDKKNYFIGEELVRLERIFHEYYNFNRIPDWEDVDFILGQYSGSDTRRKEILIALGVTLTIKDAYELKFINDTFLDKFSETWFEEIYMQLDTAAKESFIRGLSHDTSSLISAADFSETNLGIALAKKHKSNKLARAVFKSLSLDMPEKEKIKANTVLERIRERKKKEAKAANKEFGKENYDLYDEVVEELRILQAASAGQASTIKNIDNLKSDGATIAFTHTNGSTQYVRIASVRNTDGSPIESIDGMEYCVRLEGLNVTNSILGAPQPFDASYDSFVRFLQGSKDVSILTAEEFKSGLTTSKEESTLSGGAKILDARTIESAPVTVDNISTKLDMIDPEGFKYGFGKGTAFIAPVGDTDGKRKSEDGIWTIKAIHPGNNTVDLIDPSGHIAEKGIPIQRIYAVLLENQAVFKRVANIQDDAQMLRELNAFGVDGIKDGKLFIISKDAHDKVEEKNITCFEDKEGGHIRMQSLQDGMVRFGEYGDTDLPKAQEYAKKNGINTKVKGLYSWRQMSYATFIAYLSKENMQASPKDKIVPDASHDLDADGHAHHPHVHGSFMSRMFQMQNAASIMKGFEMMWHGIEHTLEKGAKLDAAKFALSTSRFLNLPDSVSAQVYSDVVQGSKEIVEKYEKKIFDLPGPGGRLKCLHIVENHDSRPEEVVAAMSYMLKCYGNLYGENMKHKQSYIISKDHCINANKGTFMFFDAFVITSKIGDLKYWREKSYKKAIDEMGSEEDHEGEPTEEQLLHGLFKLMDGNWEKYPYAASVTKAIGGPGGFETMWKFEGYKKSKEKGKEQTLMVNAQGRLNKAMSYLENNEIYKGIGAMEAVIHKDKSPKYSAFPFVWAVGGFTRYASHAALQDIKAYAEQSCYSFHAYSFMRQYEDNKVYKNVVKLALAKKGGQPLVDKFDGICARLERDPGNYNHTDGAASDMMELWQKHCDGEDGLHNMLQGHNGWLASQSKSKNLDVQAYIEILEGKHQMKLDSQNIEGDLAKDYYNEWGYVDSRIFKINRKTGLLSLERMLNKLNLRGTKSGDREMTDDDYKKLWAGAVNQMNAIRNLKSFSKYTEERDINTDQVAIDLQKQQFRAYRQEIIDAYVTKLNARSSNLNPTEISNILALPHKYWTDIRNMGIDPHAIFHASMDESNFAEDYERWKSATPYTSGNQSRGGTLSLDIPSLVQGITTGKTPRTTSVQNNPTFQQNPRDHGSFDDDTTHGAGAAYIAPDDADTH